MTNPPIRKDAQDYVRDMNGSGNRRLYSMSVPLARRVVHRLSRQADLPLEKTSIDVQLSMPTGQNESINLRLFDSRAHRAAGPVMLYYHGGGWALGDTEVYASLCAEIARRLDLPLVSVEYRRAPEFKSPIGQHDCEAAARWVAQKPAALPVTATSLILAGDSCGGAYAISTAMALRDAPAALPVIAQLALYPAADLATRYPSFKEFATGYLLDKHLMRWFAEQFAPDDSDFRASPMAGDLAGLPPAFVVTAELDPLRDQGHAYAKALAAANVPVITHEAKGMVHAFLSMRRAIPSAQTELETVLSRFRLSIVQNIPA